MLLVWIFDEEGDKRILQQEDKRLEIIVSPRGIVDIERPEKLYDRVRPILDRCTQEEMSLPAAYAPYLCRDTKREDLRELLIRLTEECIRICGRTGCTSLIVRPLFSGVKSGEHVFAAWR